MRKLLFTILLASVLFMLGACSDKSSGGSGGGSDSITIGAQTYTETKILAEMYKALIEDATDVSVSVKPDLATSPIILEGMRDGELDMSTQYTGTAIASFTDIENPQDVEATIEQAKDFFGDDEFDFEILEGLGFANTYVIAIRNDLAEENNIENVSDLEEFAPDFSAGFDTSWLERDNDGYPAFSEMYGFEFGDVNPMEIGLVYDALKNKEVDIVLAYSTDPRIVAYDLKILEDDQNFFPPYDALPFLRQDVMDAHPEIAEAVEPLLGAFDETIIAELNGKVDNDGEEIQDVAIEYLKEQNLLE